MGPPAQLRLAACLLLVFISMGHGCVPSRPIPPARGPGPGEPRNVDFSEEQRERLGRLRTALSEQSASDVSGGLLVRLAFDESADLDLFVTDPMQESVYFANSPSRSGGRLIDDRRCDDPSPRVEEVHFSEPPSGRYRVGVDFHGRCRDGSSGREAGEEGLYVVRIEEGGRVLDRAGMLAPGRFEVIVIEFDVE